ncbi:MAG: hypothetical protein QM762_04525 [Chryseolinea sp.]
MKNVVIVLVIGFLSFITYVNWDTEGDGEIDLNKITYGVLRLNYGNRELFGDTCTYHIVSRADIRNAEKILRRELENYNSTAKYPHSHEDYGRQFLGARTPGGDVLMYVACFLGPDYHQKLWLIPVVVYDGGDSYIDVLMNVTTGEVLSFSPHGGA